MRLSPRRIGRPLMERSRGSRFIAAETRGTQSNMSSGRWTSHFRQVRLLSKLLRFSDLPPERIGPRKRAVRLLHPVLNEEGRKIEGYRLARMLVTLAARDVDVGDDYVFKRNDEIRCPLLSAR